MKVTVLEGSRAVHHPFGVGNLADWQVALLRLHRVHHFRKTQRIFTFEAKTGWLDFRNCQYNLRNRNDK